MKFNLILLYFIVPLVVACSSEDDGSTDSIAFILPDGAVVDAMLPDMETVERPEGCAENENLARLLPVLTGGKNHPTGRGEHASAYDHCNGRIILFGGNDFQPQECADFGPKRFSFLRFLSLASFKF